MKDQVDTEATTGTELVSVESKQIITAFTAGNLDPILKQIEEQVALHVPDVTTKKGRDEITSLAYKVSRSKTTLDDAGKKLTEAQRAVIEKVNGQRSIVKTRMDALRDSVRKPLDEWKAADEVRKTKHREALNSFNIDRTHFDQSAADIQAVIDEVAAVAINDDWEEFEDMAEKAQSEALVKYGRDLEAATVRETQDAKIKALEAERAQREAEAAAEAAARAEREAKEKAAAEERARKDQEAQDKIQQEAAEKQRLEDKAKADAERAAQQAEADKKRAADEAAAAEAQRSSHADRLVEYVEQLANGMIGGEPQPYGILRYEMDNKLPQEKDAVGDHWQRVQEAIDAAQSSLDQIQKDQQEAAEKRQRDELAAKDEAHKAELAKAEQRERDRLAAQTRAEEEARAKRAADEEHRNRILKKVSEAISAYPIDQLAEAILDGKIPHVRMDI